MELQFENRPCRFLRCNVRDVREQEQTQEVRLPDGMPDIGTILGAWGQCVMRSKEWNSDSIGASGGVMAWVLYAPAEGGVPIAVEAWLPVQMKWNMPAAQRTGTIRCDWLLKGVDGRVLSARKMMVRANVCVLAEALEPCEEESYAAGTVSEDVQLLKNTYPVRLNMEAGEKAFTMDEELELPGGSPVPEKILYCTMMPRITEQKVLGGKAVFRGEGCVHMLYRSADGQLYSHDQQIGFSQFADLDRDYDKDALVSTTVALSALEPELQDGHIRLKCGLVAQYVISDRVMLELTEDAYSPVRSVTMESRELRLPAVLDQRQENVRFGCSIPEAAAQVVDISVHMEQPAVRRAGELTQLTCAGQAQVLYYDENGSVRGACGRWSGEWELPAASDTEIMAALLFMEAPQTSLNGDQLEVSGQLMVETTAVARQPMTMLTKLELGEMAQPDPGRPSLILRRAGEDSLWQIAKATGSTVGAIQEANGLAGEPMDDRLLLIPVS